MTICAENNTTSGKANANAEKEAKATTTKQEASVHLVTKIPLPEVSARDIAAVKAYKENGVANVSMKCGMDVTILDFAGQVQYHNTHSVFIRKDNLIMIVFNAAQPLSANVKIRSSSLRHHLMTYSENIHFWMKTVHSTCREPGDDTDKASLLPVIMLVATHIDLLEGSVQDAKEEIIHVLAEELKGKPYAEHLAGHGEGLLNALRKYCIFLSNKDRDSTVIRQLQDTIIEVALPILSKEYPLVYLKIERKLLSMEQGVITLEEFHEVAHRCGLLATIDSKEFANALEYFHNKGTVLNFPSIESLRNLVILSPHWLTKMLSYLLIAHPYKHTGKDRDISFDTLKQRGILLESFLSHMLDLFNTSGVVGYQIKQAEAVHLLKWFGFLAPISSNTKILDKKVEVITQERRLYVVPSLLPDDEQDQKKIPVKDNENVRMVYFYFPEKFLPSMLFNHVVAMCINRNEEKREDLVWYVVNKLLYDMHNCLFRLRRGKVKIVLDRKQDYCVSLCEEISSIQLSFLLRKKDSSAKHRYQLFQHIQACINKFMKDFMKASTTPKIYVPCYFKECNDLHIELQLVCNKEYQYCHTEEEAIPDDYYFDLFSDQGWHS